MTLAEFLLARIAEDERVAVPDLELTQGRRTGIANNTYFDAEIGRDRWLAECDAKRRIVEKFAPVVADGGDGEYRLRQVFEFLALPYADHPDYREEWKP